MVLTYRPRPAGLWPTCWPVLLNSRLRFEAERILAGQAAARAAGKVWGGGKPGRQVALAEEKERAIKQLSKEGKGIS